MIHHLFLNFSWQRVERECQSPSETNSTKDESTRRIRVRIQRGSKRKNQNSKSNMNSYGTECICWAALWEIAAMGPGYTPLYYFTISMYSVGAMILPSYSSSSLFFHVFPFLSLLVLSSSMSLVSNPDPKKKSGFITTQSLVTCWTVKIACPSMVTNLWAEIQRGDPHRGSDVGG